MTMRVPFYDYPVASAFQLFAVILSGKRPTKPEPGDLAFVNLGLTEELWELMERCWQEEPDQRPTAKDIQGHPLFASLQDNRLSYQESGELTAAQIRQNKVVISLRAAYNDPYTMTSMYTSAT